MRRSTILLVDDDTAVTDALKRTLRRERYETLCAASAQEALELLARHPVDVVVSDEIMPVMRGSDLLGFISQAYPETMRIVLTGRADLETALRAINQGHIFRFLIKPCEDNELLSAIRQAVQYRELTFNSRRLLRNFRLQNALLQQLETLHPGITEVRWNATGAIEIPETDWEADVEALVRELDGEAAKAESRLRLHSR